MSQETFIYDERANSVLSICLKVLIKKKSSCFLQRVVCVLCHAGGAFLFTIEKVKTKKRAMYRLKK